MEEGKEEDTAAELDGEAGTLGEVVGRTVEVELAVEGTSHYGPSHWVLVGDILAEGAMVLEVEVVHTS